MDRFPAQKLLDPTYGIHDVLHLFRGRCDASLRHESIEVNIATVTSPQCGEQTLRFALDVLIQRHSSLRGLRSIKRIGVALV
jgi:hypothetical protein